MELELKLGFLHGSRASAAVPRLLQKTPKPKIAIYSLESRAFWQSPDVSIRSIHLSDQNDSHHHGGLWKIKLAQHQHWRWRRPLVRAFVILHCLKSNTRLTFYSGNNATQGQQTSQPQSSGGLFGSSTAQQPASGGLFGSSTATTQPASGGLFGGLNKAATTAAPSGGLFGASTTQTTQPASGGLFGGVLGGNTQTQNQTTAQSGGLFGGASGGNNPSAPQSGGLFGGAQSKPSLL